METRVGIEELVGDLLDPVGVDAVDALDRLLERNGAAPQDLLAGDLAGARRRAFERHQQAGADLVAHPLDLVVGDGVGGAAQFVEHDIDEIVDLVAAGRRGNAENAAVGEGPVEGIDRIAKARGSPGPPGTGANSCRRRGSRPGPGRRRSRPNCRAGPRGRERYGPARDRSGSAPRRRHSAPLPGRSWSAGLEAGEALLGDAHQLVVVDIAGGGQDHAVAGIVAVHIGADGVGMEAAHGFGGAEDGAADRLVGIGDALEQVEDVIVRIVARRADLLDDDLLLARQLALVEHRILQDVGDDVGGQAAHPP